MIFQVPLFKSRGKQAFEIPAEIEFPDWVKKVRFVKSGEGLIMNPVVPRTKKSKREQTGD